MTLSALPMPSRAATTTYTWANTGNDWATPADWGQVTNFPGKATTDIANFGSAASVQPNLGGSQTIGELTFGLAGTGYDLTASTNAALSITGTTAIAASNTSGTNTIDLPVTLTGTTAINQAAGGTLVINGNIGNTSTTGTVTLTFGGAGTIKLTGANAYSSTNTTRIETASNGGNLILGFAATGASSGTVSNILSSSSTLLLGTVVPGTGTLTLNGAASTANSQTFAGILGVGGDEHIVLNPGSGGGTMTLNLGAFPSGSKNRGSTIDITTNGQTVTTTTAAGSNPVANTMITLNGTDFAVITAGTGGTNNLVAATYKQVSGINPSGTNNAVLDLVGSTELTTKGTSNVQDLRFNNTNSNYGSSNPATLTIDSGVTLNLSGSSANSAAGILVTANVGANNTLIAGTGTITGSASRDLALLQNDTQGVLQIDASIAGGGLTKSGLGSAIVDGTNTYGNETAINAGTLEFGKEVSLYGGTTSSWTFTGATINVASGATFALGVGADASGFFTTSDLGLIETNMAASTSTVGMLAGSILGLDTTNAGTGGFTYNGALGNAGASGINAVGLAKMGTNTLTLGGTNTYTGPTVVRNGTLNIVGSITSPVTVGDTSAVAVLGGTGVIGGAVTTQATSGSSVAHLAPGANSTGSNFGTAGGTLTINGPLTLGAGTNLDIDLSTATDSGNDLIAVSGLLTIGNALTVNINELGGSLVTGTDYALISGFTNDLSLNGVGFTTNVAGYTATYEVVQNGNTYSLDVDFTSTSVTPTAAFYNGQGTSLNASADYDTDGTSGTPISAGPDGTTNVAFSADRNTLTTTSVSAPLTVNSLTFGTGTGTSSGMVINATDTGSITIMAGTSGNNPDGNGITVNSGSDTINAPVVLGATQTWTTLGSSSLTVNGAISELSAGTGLTKAGSGRLILTHDNTFSGPATVSAGQLLLGNGTSGSATGTGSLTVTSTGTLGGYSATPVTTATVVGTSKSTSFSISGSVIVGTGQDAVSKLDLIAPESTGSFTGANLTFNLDSASSNANVLELGSTDVTFSDTVLTLNVLGAKIITPGSSYTLITDDSAFTAANGLTLKEENGLEVIVGGLSINDSALFGSSAGNVDGLSSGFYNGSFLYVNGNQIDVEVVPEPGTWALMLGGLTLLIFWQRRRSRLP